MKKTKHRWAKVLHPLYNPICKKNSYSTWEAADETRRKTTKIKPRLQLYIYECKVCDSYHLTKQKQSERSAEIKRPEE